MSDLNSEEEKWELEYVQAPFPVMTPFGAASAHSFVFKSKGGVALCFQFLKPTAEEAAEVCAGYLQQMLIELRMQFPAKQPEEKKI